MPIALRMFVGQGPRKTVLMVSGTEARTSWSTALSKMAAADTLGEVVWFRAACDGTEGAWRVNT